MKPNDESTTVLTLELPEDPGAAKDMLISASMTAPVLVFKKSPICPVSFAAEDAYREFLSGNSGALQVAEIDVIAQKPLARGLTAELGIRHESPQALVFSKGEFVWNASHESLTVRNFRAALDL
jgi:monothiol bacilliredoxin